MRGDSEGRLLVEMTGLRRAPAGMHLSQGEGDARPGLGAAIRR